MADVGDDLLEGDLDDTTFGDLDGEEEDALLADDDFESFEHSRQDGYSSQQVSNLYRMDQVQEVSEGDEIIEDAEDVLELAAIDELEDAELDNGQANGQEWAESSSLAVGNDSGRIDSTICVISSTEVGLGGDSDEEESDGRGSRFKTERTNVISLKRVSSGKTLSDIPDTLDNVQTTVPSISQGVRPRGGFQQRGKGSVRGRLGPIHRGGMVRRGLGLMRRPNPMMRMPNEHYINAVNKIHVNPHFRGPMNHQPQGVWDNERLPPPPGCELFGHPRVPRMENNWGGPPPPHVMRPPFPPQQPGPPPQFQTPPNYPQQPQGYEERFQHPVIHQPQQNQPRRVQFSENSQLVTVENQHFQKPSFEPSFGPGNSQLQTSNFNNNTFPNHFGNMPTRPNFQPQPQPPHLVPAQTFDGYPAQEFHPPQQGPPVNYNNSSNWTSAPHIVEAPQGQMYTSQQPLPLQGFPQQQPGPPQFCPPFPQNQPNFRPHQPAQYKARMRGSVLKRALPRKTPIVTSSPVKQMRFDHNKQKSPVVNTRSNLQEIKTVDNLPDTTTSQEPEPEIEEDEETKQYRKKIVEQKALREMILKQKEARRLASIKEKQKQGGPTLSVRSPSEPPQLQTNNNKLVLAKQLVQLQAKQPMQLQAKQLKVQASPRGRPALKTISVTRAIPRTQIPNPDSGTPVVQMQQMLGTMYKIVKVRTKEGAIVTRKTPMNMTEPQRRIVLNAPGQPMRMNVGQGATNIQGRTLLKVRTTSPGQINVTKPLPRVVIDNNMKVAVAPNLPVSTVVIVNNLSLSTSPVQLMKLAKQVGKLASIKHEPDLKRATLKFQKPKDAEQFYHKFHRKMIDLSRIIVSVVPE